MLAELLRGFYQQSCPGPDQHMARHWQWADEQIVRMKSKKVQEDVSEFFLDPSKLSSCNHIYHLTQKEAPQPDFFS